MAGTIKSKTPDNTIPSWLLPCTYYLPSSQYHAKLRLGMLCVIGSPPSAHPLLHQISNLKIQIFEFTCCNERFSIKATVRKLNKYYVVLLLLLSQQGWETLPPIICSVGIQGTIHIWSSI